MFKLFVLAFLLSLCPGVQAEQQLLQDNVRQSAMQCKAKQSNAMRLSAAKQIPTKYANRILLTK